MGIINIKIADILFNVETVFDYSEKYCKDYLINTNGDCLIKINLNDIQNEKQYIENNYFLDKEDYLESTALLRKIADQMPKYDGLLVHGAAISYKDKCYMFVAPSGTGKTTHIKLWMKHINDLKVINGDKPIVRLIDGKPFVFGTPWCGKERYGYNECCKLDSIIILERGSKDSIARVNAKDYLNDIFNKVYMPTNQEMILKTIDLIDKIFSKVNVYKLECTMDDSAFYTSYRGLTGKEYESNE